MLVSFDWYKYSFFGGFRKREIKAPVIPDLHRSGLSGIEPSESQLCGYRGTYASEDLFHLANAAKSELCEHIRQSATKEMGKQELLLSLRTLLKSYTALASLQAHAFQIAINNAIEYNVEKYCSIQLARQELAKLWQPGSERDLC